jgi:hypothetical protein
LGLNGRRRGRAALSWRPHITEVVAEPGDIVPVPNARALFFIIGSGNEFSPAALIQPGHGAKKSGIAIMPTSREYRHRAEECLKLANEAAEIYARMALLELAGDFRAMAQQLDLRARRAIRRTNAKQRVFSAAVHIRP